MNSLFQLNKSEEKQRDTETALHTRDTQLVMVETELKHVNRNVAALESDRAQMKIQLDRLNEEIRSFNAMNSILEQRLSVEKNMVSLY